MTWLLNSTTTCQLEPSVESIAVLEVPFDNSKIREFTPRSVAKSSAQDLVRATVVPRATILIIRCPRLVILILVATPNMLVNTTRCRLIICRLVDWVKCSTVLLRLVAISTLETMPYQNFKWVKVRSEPLNLNRIKGKYWARTNAKRQPEVAILTITVILWISIFSLTRAMVSTRLSNIRRWYPKITTILRPKILLSPVWIVNCNLRVPLSCRQLLWLATFLKYPRNSFNNSNSNRSNKTSSKMLKTWISIV
jgi:hypothetical protein